MIYGYARVSTEGQSVAAQVATLTDAGAKKIFQEKASGAKTDRAQLHKLLNELDEGDVLPSPVRARISSRSNSASPPRGQSEGARRQAWPYPETYRAPAAGSTDEARQWRSAHRDSSQLQRQSQHYFKAPRMSAVVLYRIDSAKHMHRYYRMDVQLDLFGAWCLVREWGRIGRAGQTRSAPFPTPHEAEAALHRQYKAKQRRGYLT